MSTVVILAILAAVAVIAVRITQGIQSRRQADIERAGEDAVAFVADQRLGRGLALELPIFRSVRGQVRLTAGVERLQSLARLPGSGLIRLIRLLCVPLMTALIILSGTLNVRVFVALLGSNGLAVTMGIGATVIEVALAVKIAELVTHREPRALGWQVQCAAAITTLIAVVVLVASFAPARAHDALDRVIDLDQRSVTAIQGDGQSSALDRVALEAAGAKLAADQRRLEHAVTADRTQAIIFPVAEAIVGESALAGLLLIGLLIRFGWVESVVWVAHRRLWRSLRRERRIDRRWGRRVRRALRGAGIDPRTVLTEAGDWPPRAPSDPPAPIHPYPTAIDEIQQARRGVHIEDREAS
jgi:hypothetical protein